MSLAQRKPPTTVAEFLDWVQGQEGHWEFDGFGPVPRGGEASAMAGGTVEHLAIEQNLALAVGGRLRARGGPCRFFGSNAQIETGAGRTRLPDGLVSCAPQQRGATLVALPAVVFEILSPSTQRTDPVRKLAEYGATPSILRYVMLEQEEAAATVLARPDGGSEWTARVVGAGGTLDLPEVGLSVPLGELYEGVAFGDAAPAAPPPGAG